MQNFISILRRGLFRRTPRNLVSFFVFFCLFVTRTGRTGGPILTIYTSYDVFLPKDVPFGGLVDTAPHLGGQIKTGTQLPRPKMGIAPPIFGLSVVAK